MSGWTYAKSGVNIDQKSEAIEALVSEVSYKRQGIGQAVRMSGLFASLIDFGDRYITMATDGVGSKLLIAEELNKWDTVGIDCIAMNVNDTICVNAEPTSFVDYIAIDKPNPEITEEIGKGLQKGAELSNMEIVGGEIAVLPENERSLAVARKIGARYEGRRTAYMYVRGCWRDHETFALLAEDAGDGFARRISARHARNDMERV